MDGDLAEPIDFSELERTDRGGPRAVGEEGDLTEEVAGAHLANASELRTHEGLHLASNDEIHPVGFLSLPEDESPRSQDLPFQVPGHLSAKGRIGTSEELHALEDVLLHMYRDLTPQGGRELLEKMGLVVPVGVEGVGQFWAVQSGAFHGR